MTIVIDGTNGITGPQSDNDTTINGVTVGKGGGSVSTNTVLGTSALPVNSSGANNIAIGYNSGTLITTGSQNTLIGSNSGATNVTGTYNTFVGYSSGNGNGGSHSDNVGVGANTFASVTTGNQNVAIGRQALALNTTGSNNTAVGYQAGYTGTIANDNAYFGWNAGNLSTGSSNTFIGDSAGKNMTTGQSNTILGRFNGNNGGLDIRTASNYIVLCDGDGNVRGYFDNSGIFNVGQTVNGITNSNGFTLNVSSGSMSQNHVSGTSSGAYYSIFGYNGSIIGSITQSGTTAVLYNVTSDQRLKENIVDAPDASNDIDAIKVRSFDFIADKSPVKYGFIAQELVTVAPDAVHQPSNPDDMMGVDYSKLVPMMLKELQSLRARLKAANIA